MSDVALPVLPGLTTETLADRAYGAIRETIATGELRPGQKVTERGLAAELQVSATPVREAIRRLEQDGLLERTGPRTVTVSQIGDAAIQDLAEVEVALRGMVARFAARHAGTEQLDRLDAILDETDDLLIVIKQRLLAGDDVSGHVDRVLDAMQRFNELVSACAGNAVLVRLLDQSQVFSRGERRSRVMALIARNDEFGLGRYATHRRLVRALRDRDPGLAEEIAVEDARGSLSELLSDAHAPTSA